MASSSYSTNSSARSISSPFDRAPLCQESFADKSSAAKVDIISDISQMRLINTRRRGWSSSSSFASDVQGGDGEESSGQDQDHHKEEGEGEEEKEEEEEEEEEDDPKSFYLTPNVCSVAGSLKLNVSAFRKPNKCSTFAAVDIRRAIRKAVQYQASAERTGSARQEDTRLDGLGQRLMSPCLGVASTAKPGGQPFGLSTDRARPEGSADGGGENFHSEVSNNQRQSSWSRRDLDGHEPSSSSSSLIEAKDRRNHAQKLGGTERQEVIITAKRRRTPNDDDDVDYNAEHSSFVSSVSKKEPGDDSELFVKKSIHRPQATASFASCSQLDCVGRVISGGGYKPNKYLWRKLIFHRNNNNNNNNNSSAGNMQQTQQQPQVTTIHSIQSLSMQLDRAASSSSSYGGFSHLDQASSPGNVVMSPSLDQGTDVCERKPGGSESNLRSSSNKFGRLVGKKAARVKELLLQNLGRADRTTDQLFELYEENFYKQQNQANRLAKEFKQYMSAMKGFHEASKNLNKCVQVSTGDYQCARHDLVCENLTQFEHLNEDVMQKLREQVMQTVGDYLTQFVELKEKISKRRRKLIDYDSSKRLYEVTLVQVNKKRQKQQQLQQQQACESSPSSSNANNNLLDNDYGMRFAAHQQQQQQQQHQHQQQCLQTNDSLAASQLVDEARLLKLREQYNYCKIMYESINSELQEELPIVYEKKMKSLLMTLQNYFALEAHYHSNAGKLLATISDVIDEMPTTSLASRASQQLKKALHDQGTSSSDEDVGEEDDDDEDDDEDEDNYHHKTSMVQEGGLKVLVVGGEQAPGGGSSSGIGSSRADSSSCPESSSSGAGSPDSAAQNHNNNNNNNNELQQQLEQGKDQSSDIDRAESGKAFEPAESEPAPQQLDTCSKVGASLAGAVCNGAGESLAGEDELDKLASSQQLVDDDGEIGIGRLEEISEMKMASGTDNHLEPAYEHLSAPGGETSSWPVLDDDDDDDDDDDGLDVHVVGGQNLIKSHDGVEQNTELATCNKVALEQKQNNDSRELGEVEVEEKEKNSNAFLYKVKTNYKYLAEDVDELCFEADEVIQVVEFDATHEPEEGWLLGIRELNGQRGLFPANFTRPI